MIISRALYPGNHPHIAQLLNNMGEVYQSLEKLDGALNLHEKSLKMKKELYQGDHLDITKSLNNLAETYLILDDKIKATSLYTRSLDMTVAILGNEHSESEKLRTIIMDINNLSSG